MATLPVTSVPIISDDYYEFDNGLLIVDIDESTFTDTMKRYLTAIAFQGYTKVTDNGNDTYIPIRDLSILWNDHIDEAIRVEDVPTGTYVTIKPILDDSVATLKDKDGNLLYPDVDTITSFPITISLV